MRINKRKVVLRGQITTFLLFLLLFLALSSEVVACTCDFISACQAYTRGDAVFVGKIISIHHDGDPSSFFHNRTVRFSVQRIFKGSVSKTETVTFLPDSCSDRILEVGRTYFVYREKGGLIRPCSRTHELLASGPNDLGFVKGLSKTNPTFAIGVEIPNLTPRELGAAKVSVTDGVHIYDLRSDSEGQFRVTLTKPKKYRVQILLPFEAVKVEVTSLRIGFPVETIRSRDSTIISYGLDFIQNGCDERVVNFIRAGQSGGLSSWERLVFLESLPYVEGRASFR